MEMVGGRPGILVLGALYVVFAIGYIRVLKTALS